MASGNLVNVTATETLDPERAIFYMLIIVISVISNGLVLFVLRHQKELHDNMRVLYQILATSDLILSISWSSWNMIWFSFKNEQTCAIISLVFPFVFMVSIWFVMLALFAISFNLYLLITKPLRYPTIVTRTRLFVTLGSAGATTMLVCGVYLPIPESPLICLLVQHCRTRDVRPTAEWPSVVFMFHLLSPILATMFFTTIIYIRLLVIACHKEKTVANHPAPVFGRNKHGDGQMQNARKHGTGQPQKGPGPNAMKNPNRRPKRGVKGLTTVLLLIGSFYIVWISFIVFFSRSWNPHDLAILDKFAVCSTWVQPIVYLLTNPEARRICLKTLRCDRGAQSLDV